MNPERIQLEKTPLANDHLLSLMTQYGGETAVAATITEEDIQAELDSQESC